MNYEFMIHSYRKELWEFVCEMWIMPNIWNMHEVWWCRAYSTHRPTHKSVSIRFHSYRIDVIHEVNLMPGETDDTLRMSLQIECERERGTKKNIKRPTNINHADHSAQINKNKKNSLYCDCLWFSVWMRPVTLWVSVIGSLHHHICC